MRIVTYNIQWGKGRDGVIDLDRIARTVADADIICLQEVERNWRAGPHSDQPARLAALLPDHHAVYAPAIDLHDARPGAARGARRQFGLLTLSRWPILSSRVFPLPKFPVHGHPNDVSCLHEAVIAPEGGQGLRVYHTHLNYLSPRQRRMQLVEILRQIEDAPRQGGPVTGKLPAGEFGEGIPTDFPDMPRPAVLLGDFNMRPTSGEYDLIVGERDSYYGRLAEIGSFADAMALAGMGETDGVTFPGPYPDGVQRIDHVFLSAELVPAFARAWIDNEAEGSDHQPVFAELSFPGQGRGP